MNWYNEKSKIIDEFIKKNLIKRNLISFLEDLRNEVFLFMQKRGYKIEKITTKDLTDEKEELKKILHQLLRGINGPAKEINWEENFQDPKDDNPCILEPEPADDYTEENKVKDYEKQIPVIEYEALMYRAGLIEEKRLRYLIGYSKYGIEIFYRRALLRIKWFESNKQDL